LIRPRLAGFEVTGDSTGGETDTGATQGERTESGTGAMGKKVKKALICY
jgi:hypothetical protein